MAFALLAAIAFGLTIPLIDRFGKDAGAIPIAALLYAGAALATVAGSSKDTPVRRGDLPRLAAVALFGAVIAPVLLVWGMRRTSAASAALLLNFEAVFTVLLAWRLHREPIGRRVAIALGAMVIGGIVLASAGPATNGGWGPGALAVIGATLAWALDNALTRPLADRSPNAVVRWKAILGATATLALSLALGQKFPRGVDAFGLVVCGATGYGLSLRFYLLAQRRIGAGRTGSIFALAPFLGAAVAWALGDRALGTTTLFAATLFALGVYLHLTEEHAHGHAHDPIDHEHLHRHDDGHHDHVHEPAVKGEHSHMHHHDAMTHDHAHGSDLHHQHHE